jgi:hypothetical protein
MGVSGAETGDTYCVWLDDVLMFVVFEFGSAEEVISGQKSVRDGGSRLKDDGGGRKWSNEYLLFSNRASRMIVDEEENNYL